MNKTKADAIKKDRELNATTYRSLGRKYGISHSMVFRMFEKAQKEVPSVTIKAEENPEEVIPLDEESMAEALRKSRLENELLRLVINIAGKELGEDLLKKHGTRQSR
jgi:hypothetical protein